MSKALLILTVALILASTFASLVASRANILSVSGTSQISALTRPDAAQGTSEASRELKNEEVPLGFRGVDFRNLSYPIGGKRVRLINGKYEFETGKTTGSGWLDFADIHYSDMNGDGKKEAIVQLIAVSCGVSCDGGSHLFYFYSSKRGRVTLLSRLATGGLAFQCGLKSFVLEKRNLTLELFRTCRLKGWSFQPLSDANEVGGKFIAHSFTRFAFQFNGRNFALKKREVLSNSQEDIRNYQPKVDISNE